MLGFIIGVIVGICIGWTFPQPEWAKRFFAWVKAKATT
jgi:hypothetical protein